MSNLTAGGVVEYKCRRCGEVKASLHAPRLFFVLLDATSLTEREMQDKHGPQAPAMLGHHSCADGGHGVADLIGGKPDAEGPE